MAQNDNILRFRIDSTEYDSKIKSATDGLSRFMDSLKKGTSNIRDIDKASLEYVKALGQMETKSTTVRGRIAELSKAYMELQSRYKQLGNEAKGSDFGKAMAESLEQIRQRVVEAKKEMNDLGKSIGNIPTGTKEVGGSGSLLVGVNDAITAAQGGLAGMLGSLSRLGPQAAAIGGIGAAIIGIGSSAISARKNIENLELNIGTLLGSVEKGKELVQELQQYGQATPYDTEGLAGAARTMLAYGVSAEQIMPLMRQLGDVAQGNTQSLNSLALAFGQMTAVGTVQKQDLNQMANAGFGFNQIAKSMGITVEEFLDMVSKKKVGVEDIAKALEDATSEGGLFYNSAINASQGLEGTFSNFDEALTNTKAKLGAIIEPAVIEMVKSLGDGIEGLTQGLGGSQEAAEVFAMAGEGLGSVIKGLFEKFSDVIGIVETFGEIIDEVRPVIEAITPPVDSASSAVSGLNGKFAEANSSPLVSAIKDLFNPLNTVLKSLRAVRDAIIAAKKAVFGEPEGTKPGKGSSKNTGSGSSGNAKNTRRPVRAGEKIEDTTYYSERYGSAQNGVWVWSEAGAARYNKANPQPKKTAPKSAPKPAAGKSSSTGGKNKEPKTSSDIQKEIKKLSDEWATTTSTTRRKSIERQISSLNRQKSELDKVSNLGKPKTTTPKKATPKREKTEEEKNNEKLKSLRNEYNSSKTTEERKAAIVEEVKAINERNKAIARGNDELNGIKAGSVEALNKDLGELRKSQNLSTTSREWEEWQQQIEGVELRINEIKGIKPGSLQALNAELGDIKEKQNLSATNEEWRKWGREIDEVKKKIEAITTPDMSKMTNNGISAFVNDLKKRIDEADLGSDLQNSLIKQLNLTNLFQNLVNAGQESGADFGKIDTAKIYSDIQLGANPEEIQSGIMAMLDAVNAAREGKGQGELGINGDGSLVEQPGSGEDVMDQANKVISGLSSVAGGLQAMGIKLPDGVNKVLSAAQGLMQVIQGVMTIISVFSTSQQTVTNSNLVALNAMLPGVISALWAAAAASWVPFHNGGIVHAADGYAVPGNSFSGDLVPAMLNSGELVLNQAQQGNLAAQLSGNEGAPAGGASWVTGENIYIALNTFLHRRGMGELVAFKKK